MCVDVNNNTLKHNSVLERNTLRQSSDAVHVVSASHGAMSEGQALVKVWLCCCCLIGKC